MTDFSPERLEPSERSSLWRYAPPVTRIEDFDFSLPESKIAQTPLADRAASRLLVDRGAAAPEHRNVSGLVDLLEPGDLLVVNNTKVLAARIHATRPTGGRSEVLLLEPDGPAPLALRSQRSEWTALVRPSKKIAPGTELAIADESDLGVTVGEDLGEGRRRVVIESSDLEAALIRVGQMPLPPYITEPLAEPDRYQTVYAEHVGSAAAPTAGLHLTEELLGALTDRGVGIARVELIVGLDTFRPVTVSELDDHHMHSERYHVPSETTALLQQTKATGGSIVAVGTTTVRALESAAMFGPEGATDLFIRDPFDFQVVDVLLTNFHMPKSTLLVMIDAFIGPRWRRLYDEALSMDYRFLSFGDAMLLDRRAN